MPSFEIVFADEKTNSADLQFVEPAAHPIEQQVLHPEQSNRARDIVSTELPHHSLRG